MQQKFLTLARPVLQGRADQLADAILTLELSTASPPRRISDGGERGRVCVLATRGSAFDAGNVKQSSYSAKAGYPVRRELSVLSLTPRNTGSPAFAGDDEM